MKRFHVHVSVDDITTASNFYSTLFGAEPTVLKNDYAKWMLDDPRVNFAISTRGQTPGLDHLGIQVDDDSDIDELSDRLAAAGMTQIAQPDAACCYAAGNKNWSADPSGIAWETFHTMGEIVTFHNDDDSTDSCNPSRSVGACCPVADQGQIGESNDG